MLILDKNHILKKIVIPQIWVADILNEHIFQPLHPCIFPTLDFGVGSGNCGEWNIHQKLCTRSNKRARWSSQLLLQIWWKIGVVFTNPIKTHIPHSVLLWRYHFFTRKITHPSKTKLFKKNNKQCRSLAKVYTEVMRTLDFVKMVEFWQWKVFCERGSRQYQNIFYFAAFTFKTRLVVRNLRFAWPPYRP